MATVSTITTVANATAPAHGFRLVTRTGNKGEAIALFEKKKTGASGTTGRPVDTWGYGESATGNFTTAKTQALASLNATRLHRYAASPSAPSGSTVGAWPDGLATVPTVDVS
jgi:hypothetical protein